MLPYFYIAVFFLPRCFLSRAAMQLYHMAFPPVKAMIFSYSSSCSVAVGATRLHIGTKPAQSEVTPWARTTYSTTKRKDGARM